MVPVMSEMAKAAGLSNDELTKMFQNGVDAKDGLKLLEIGISAVTGHLEKVETFDAAVTRLTNNIKKLLTVNEDQQDASFLTKAIDAAAVAVEKLDRLIDKSGASFDGMLKKALPSMSLMEIALDAVNGKITSQGELFDALKKAIFGVGEEHDKTKEKAVGAYDAIAHEAERLKRVQQDSIQQLNLIKGLYEDLGIIASTDLQKTADDMKSAFDKIKVSGKETADTIDTAFLKLAEAQIKASNAAGQTIPEWLKAEASARGLSLELSNLVDELSKAEGGFQKISDSRLDAYLSELSDKMKQTGLSAEELSRYSELSAEKQRRLLEASISLSKAREDARAADEKWRNEQVELSNVMDDLKNTLETENEKIESQVLQKRALIEMNNAHIKTLELEIQQMQFEIDKTIEAAGGYSKLSEEKKKEIDAREYAVNIKKKEIEATETQNKKLEAELKQLVDLENAYKKLGIESSKSLQNTAEEMKDAFEKIKQSGAPINDIKNAFRALMEEQVKASKAAGTTTPEWLKQQAAALGLGKELQDLSDKYRLLGTEYDNNAGRADGEAQRLERIRQGLLDNAEQVRDYFDLSKQMEEQRYNEYKSWESGSEAVKKYSDNIDNLVPLTQEELNNNQKIATSLALNNEMHDKMIMTYGEYQKYLEYLNTLQKKNNINLLEEAEKRQSLIDTEKEEIQNKYQEIQASGDLEKTIEVRNQLYDKEIESLNQSIEIRERKLQVMRDEYNELKNNEQASTDAIRSKAAEIKQAEDELEVSKKSIETKKEQLKASTDRANALDKEKLAQLELNSASQAFTGIIQGWEQRLGNWSDAAKRAFQTSLAGANSLTEGIDELDSSMKRNEADTRVALTNMSDGFVGWANKTALKALEVERSFLGQAAAAEQLAKQLEGAAQGAYGSTVQIEQMIRTAESAKNSMNLLDDTRLNNLKSAIDSAKQKLEALRQEAEDAKNELESMNAELARERGDTYNADLIEAELNYKEKLTDIEKKLAEAEAEHNTELINLYQKQKQVLEEIYNQKEQNIKQDEADRKQQAAQNTTSSTTKTSSSSSSGSGGVTHTINLKASDGTSAFANVPDEEMVNRFLTVLQKSGMRIAG